MIYKTMNKRKLEKAFYNQVAKANLPYLISRPRDAAEAILEIEIRRLCFAFFAFRCC